MRSIDNDYKTYVDAEWFKPFMYVQKKIVRHVCKRLRTDIKNIKRT